MCFKSHNHQIITKHAVYNSMWKYILQCEKKLFYYFVSFLYAFVSNFVVFVSF